MKTTSKIMTIMVVLLVIGMIFYINIKQYRYNVKIYEESINSKIIKIEDRNRGGYVFFYDTSHFFFGTTFDHRNEKFLSLGDSVSKKSKSWELNVYRKRTDGSYTYYKSFKGSKK